MVKTGFIAIWGLWLATTELWAQSIRADITEKLAPLICQSKSLNPRALMMQGIVDSGIEFYTLAPTAGASSERLNQHAQKLAQRNHHLGYAYGVCSESLHWIATMPAPEPLRWTESEIDLDIRMLGQSCNLVRADFVQAAEGKQRLLFLSRDSQNSSVVRVNSGLLTRGTVSITCTPKENLGIGPVMWWFLPIKEGPLDPPDWQIFSGNKQASLAGWINSLRKRAGFPPLAPHNVLQSAAQILVRDNHSIVHNRAELKEAADLVQKSHGQFLGENRVIADDLTQAAWLLWNSPRHRALLLEPKATHFATSTLTQGAQAISVMVFAKF